MFDGQKNELVELPNLCWVHLIYIYIYCHLNRLNHPLRLVRNSTVGWL